LLLLDNADDLDIVNAFIPSGKNGHVILTTRAQAIGEMARLIEVPEMRTEEGAFFLLRRSKYIVKDVSLDVASEIDQAKAKEIAALLGGLPLALSQAGAYIEETRCGLLGYLNLYRDRARELLGRSGATGSKHPPVATTWALSFEKIEKANPAAAELIRFCAFLHPDGIPEEVFSKGAAELGPVLGPVGGDPFALNDAIAEILKYSLFRRDLNAGSLEIHRLVQTVLKQAMDEATRRLWAERAVRSVNRAFPFGDFATWAGCERLLPQAYACAGLINYWNFEFAESAQLLNRTGFYLCERGRYTDAEPLYDRALVIREKTLNPDHPHLANSLSNLADLYYTQGRYAKAEAFYERALAIREKALGSEHRDVAEILNNLAMLCEDQGRHAQAETLYKRALAILEDCSEDRDVAKIPINLAALYDKQGRYAQAEPLYQRALLILEEVLPPDHPDRANCLNNLGRFYANQGQYPKAEPLYRQALAIREKTMGPEHPVVASSLKNLVGIYANKDQHEKVEPLYQRALAILEKTLGPEHPYVANSLKNYALCLQGMGRSQEAEPLEARARAILAKSA
jgi:tetratricopeptide (TPR) repeat protein